MTVAIFLHGNVQNQTILQAHMGQYAVSIMGPPSLLQAILKFLILRKALHIHGSGSSLFLILRICRTHATGGS